MKTRLLLLLTVLIGLAAAHAQIVPGPITAGGGSSTVTLSSTNVGATLIGGTNTVGGMIWTTNADFALDSTDSGVASGDVLAPEIQIPGAVRVSGGTAVLQAMSVVNITNASPTFTLLLCRAPITWPATNAVANLVVSELATNLLPGGIISSSDGTWKTVGTNNLWYMRNIGVRIQCATNMLYIYSVCGAAITNSAAGPASIQCGLDWD